MATLDKTSVREELDRLKADFNRLDTNKKIAPELKVIFNGLLMLVDIILVIFLERKTKKTKDNSGKPPSQTEKDESAIERKGSKGKGHIEQNLMAANTRTIETVTLIPVDTCDRCGASLENTPCQCQERRTRIDIIFEKTVEHVDAEVKQCPYCDTEVKGQFPDDMPGPLQYGNGIKAFVICLLISQMVALKRTQQMLKTLIGNMLSEATLLSYVRRLYESLEHWEIAAKAALLKQPCMHVDETALRVDKKNYWIHVYSSADITLKCLHRKRGKQAIEAINIIPRYGGTIIHDCWASYLYYKNCSHGLCGSHLLRELTFVSDSNHYRWAKNMKQLLKNNCAQVSQSPSKRLSDKQYACLQRRYRNFVTRGEAEMPPMLEKTNARRGKIVQSDAHNLLARLKKHETAVLLFARNPHVSFTNNRAERDLRMSKVKQKVSGCFRVETYAHAYCRISSYLQTMANKGINLLLAIQMALTGEIYKMDAIEKPINTRSYWNARFSSKDWENNQGKQQTLFFGQLAIDNMPSWLKVYIKNKKLSICDFGCALGQATKLLSTAFPNSDVTGQDISELGVEEARKLFPKLKFTCEDLLQITEEKYDILFSSNTLEHFYDPHDIVSKLANSTKKFIILLLPFYDDLKIDEHFYSFTYQNIPRVIDDKFSLLFYKEIDASRIPNTQWNGRQILLVYAVDSVIDELEANTNIHLPWKTSKKESRLILIDSILRAESEKKISEFLSFPIKQQLEQTLAQEQAEHQATKQQLEQTLAQEQAEHQATKQQLEQKEVFRNYVLNSFSWKLTRPVRFFLKTFKSFWGHFIKKIRYRCYLIYTKMPHLCQRILKKSVYKLRTKAHYKIAANVNQAMNKEIKNFLDSLLQTVKGEKLVAYVQPSFFDHSGTKMLCGGTERYGIELSKIFKSLGYEFWIIQYGEIPWVNVYEGITVVGLPSIVQPEEFYTAARYITNKSDICIASPFTSAINLKSSHIIGICHGVFWDNDSYQNEEFNKQLLDSLEMLDLLVSVDTATINHFRATKAIKHINKIKYIPNFVELSDKEHYETSNDDRTKILFPRRLHEARGFYIMLDLLPKLLEENKSVDFVFCGTGEIREEKALSRLIKRYPGRITHLFKLPHEMDVVYRSADIVIIPTLFSEGTSLSCLEAMSKKRAIIATCVGGLTDLIDDNFTGLLVTPNKEELYDAIVKLTDDFELRKQLAENAYNKAVSFDINFWQDKWKKIISEISSSSENKVDENNSSQKLKQELSFVHPLTYLQWDIMKQRPQHLFVALSKMGYKCLYIDAKEHVVPQVINKNLFLLDRSTQLTLNQYDCVYTYYPNHMEMFIHNKPRLLIYDVLDAPEIHASKEALINHERMLTIADVVITSSRILYNKFKATHQMKIIRYIPNAAEKSLSKINNGKDTGDFPIYSKKTIGYIGAIADWFDYVLLDKISSHFKDIQIVLIGQCREGYPEHNNLLKLLNKHENLFFLGLKPYEELVNYGMKFNVSIIPFVNNVITQNCSPVKLFEYMHYLSPIVSSNLPECNQYRSALVAKDHDEFINLINKALKIPKDDEYFKIMKKEAEENTWDARAKVIIEAINENLNAR